MSEKVENEKIENEKISRSKSNSLVCGSWLFNVQSSSSDLGQTQNDVRQQRRDEEERKNGRSILIIIPPFRAPRPQPQPPVDEDDG